MLVGGIGYGEACAEMGEPHEDLRPLLEKGWRQDNKSLPEYAGDLECGKEGMLGRKEYWEGEIGTWG